jgi:rhodanese-related sulfurtransferase
MKVRELRALLEKKGKVLLLDVREHKEFAKGDRVRGAKNMPMGQVFVEASKGKLPRNKKIVTICRTGGRCSIVAKELRKKGYDIEHLEGGIEAWKKTSKK